MVFSLFLEDFMKFILVTAKWKDNMIAFYRKMWVREDISLVKFGYQLTKIIKAKFSHMFFFKTMDENKYYVDELWLNQQKNAEDYSKYSLVDILNAHQKLIYEYDSNQDYEFVIEMDKNQTLEIPLMTDVLLIEAEGDGIFEDNIQGLRDFLNGNISEKTLYSAGEKLSKNYSFKTIFDYDYINLMLIYDLPYFLSWEDDDLNDDIGDEDEI